VVEQSRKTAENNDFLSKEVGRLRHLEQLRTVPQLVPSLQSQPLLTSGVSRIRGVCWNCGDSGHFSRTCPYPRNLQHNGMNTSQAATSVPFHVNSAHRRSNFSDGRATYLRAKVGTKICSCLLDTGSDVCLIPLSSARSEHITPTSKTLTAANGTPIEVLGEVMLQFRVDSFSTVVKGLVSDHISEVMLGIDWLVENGAVWEFGQRRIKLGNKYYPLSSRKDDTNRCRKVVLRGDVIIPPRSELNVPTNVVFQKYTSIIDDSLWGTQPTSVGPGVHVSRTLLPAATFSNIPVRVMNVLSQPVTLKSGSRVATVRPVDIVNEKGIVAQTSTPCASMAEHVERLVGKVDSSLPENAVKALRDILEAHVDVFSQSEVDLGLTDVISHHIDTADARPIRQQLRRYPPAHVEAISQDVDNMMAQGVIEPASSPWASNIVLIRKKDGSLRCCVDYRQLNSVTRKDAYPLPRIDACLDAMASAQWFSTFDLRSSYHQVKVAPCDMDKTAFICPRGMYRFRTMPFGLCNTAPTFQRLMDVVMSGYTWTYASSILTILLCFHLRLRTILTG